MNKSNIFALTKKLFLIVVAVTLLAIGVNLFLAPHQVAAGGITGLAIILEYTFGLDRALVVLFFNVFILILTFFTLGKEVFINTVIGGFLLPIILGIIPHIMLIEDKMLSVIFGSIIFGAGISILFKNKASSGGTSIPPLIIKKYTGINPSIGLFLTDLTIVTLSAFVFGIEAFFFAILSMVLTSMTMNYAEVGLNKKKTIFILSKKMEEIKEDIYLKLRRGTTLIPVQAGYEGEERGVLMLTVGNKNYQKVRDIIDSHDLDAFVIAYNVADIHGKGFYYDSPAV